MAKRSSSSLAGKLSVDVLHEVSVVVVVVAELTLDFAETFEMTHVRVDASERTFGDRGVRLRSSRLTMMRGLMYSPNSESQVTKRGSFSVAWAFQNLVNLSQLRGSGFNWTLMWVSSNTVSWWSNISKIKGN